MALRALGFGKIHDRQLSFEAWTLAREPGHRVVVNDAHARVVMANRRACETMGVTAEELSAADFFERCLTAEARGPAGRSWESEIRPRSSMCMGGGVRPHPWRWTPFAKVKALESMQCLDAPP